MSAVAACPGCLAVPDAVARAADAAGAVLTLSLPAIHCAGCIAGVERTLAAVPGVRAARVNLQARRVRIVTTPGLDVAVPLAALDAAGFEAHELDPGTMDRGDDPVGRLLLARMAVAGFAMMNVMVLSVAVWSGAADVTRTMFHWISAMVALPAVAFSAVPFFASACTALRAGRVNMDVPIALAIGLACAVSLVETWQGGHTAWFDAALSLTFFLLIGRYLDHRVNRAAKSAAAELTALEVPRVTLVDGTARRPAAVADVRPGDVLALAAGARAPVDGVALTAARLDRSALTGESLPVRVAAGGAVCAGEVVLDTPLHLRATARAEDSTLRRLAALVEVAEAGHHRYTVLADRAARVYAPAVHLLAAAALVGWWLATGDARLAVGVAVAVLIITCPCALALAGPAVNAAVAGRLFRGGVLLKSDTALERLAQVDCVLLDKTGTLTEGGARLDGLDAHAAGVALALALASDHPVSRAVVRALAGAEPAHPEALREVAGEGVHGLLDGMPVFLGRGEGGTVLRLGPAEHAVEIEERLRPGAEAAVAALLASGCEVRMLTGDDEARAARLSERLGGLPYDAAQTPADKAAVVARLTAAGRRVLMVGDGINDTAALAAAHVSIAPASALDAARAVSDAVLLGRDLTAIPDTLAQARLAVRRIRQNFALAGAYNVVAVPLALAGLATPLMAALAMSSSSITVVANAVRRAR